LIYNFVTYRMPGAAGAQTWRTEEHAAQAGYLDLQSAHHSSQEQQQQVRGVNEPSTVQ
jgi:hypothetical protein